MECLETDDLEVSHTDEVLCDSQFDYDASNFNLKKVLKFVVPPTMATINAITLYKVCNFC